MDNILIVTGGNGTKMAEATVRLLATGFPTQSANGTVTSIGDTLQIWRVDPDRSSGALSSLQRCLDEYKKLQHLMNDGNGSPRPTQLATSPWAMEVNTHIKDFDPFKLTKQSASIKNLRELLGKVPGKNEAKPILNAFYENKDLEVEIDRGFYQKPFIGAPVMAAFAESLDDQNSPAGELINLNSLKTREVRFFLCGSIYGGTGASALPVLGQFLAKQKLDHDLNNWKIGGCVLMPYCLPPAPPFNALPEHEQNDPVRIREESFRLAQIHASHPAFINLTIEERHKLARQILQGFYADPKGLHLRARHSLVYYSNILKATFDELYLVGKPEPDELKVWSNGGQSQTNPLNSAEVVAAITALNFFSGTEVCRREAYGLTTGTAEMQSQALRLSDLPCYKVNEQVVDPEKVVLATSLLIHLLKHQIQWGHDAQGWDSDPGGLRKVYEMNPDRQRADRVGYETAMNVVYQFLEETFGSRNTLGWHGDLTRLIGSIAADSSKQTVIEKMKKKGGFMMFTSQKPQEAIVFGNSKVEFTTNDFYGWSSGRQFNRGDYARFIWSKIFERAT